MRKTVFLSVILICVSAVICALILVKPSILFRNEGSIRVKGSVSKIVQSDIASWRANIKAADASASKAYEKIQESKKVAFEFLKERGISLEELSPTISLSHIYKRNDKGYATEEISSYVYTLSVSYKSNDILLIEKLSNDASALVQKGISINSYPPQYFYSKLEDLKLELMAKASENAKERAKLLVSGSGAKLGKVVSASQGVFQITKPLSNEISDYGVYDTSSLEKEVTCVVTIQFAVE